MIGGKLNAASYLSVLLLLLVSSPRVYNLVQTKVSSPLGLPALVDSKGPTFRGMMLHALVFAALAPQIMKLGKKINSAM